MFVLKTIHTMMATPNQVMMTPMLSSLCMTVEVWVNSLRSSVRPPSKSMIATASEMKMGKKSPSALGSNKPKPSGPRRKPPKSRATRVGRWSFLDKVVKKQPAPTAKQSVQSAELLSARAICMQSIIEHLTHAKSRTCFTGFSDDFSRDTRNACSWGTSWRTTLPAPTLAPSPMMTLPKTLAPAPRRTPDCILG